MGCRFLFSDEYSEVVDLVRIQLASHNDAKGKKDVKTSRPFMQDPVVDIRTILLNNPIVSLSRMKETQRLQSEVEPGR